jgi:hypothetical protein
MNRLAWHEEAIAKRQHRETFDCGEEALNEFLHRYASKSHDLGGAKTFLAIDDSDNQTILGFHSLSPASVAYAVTPEIVRRGLARTMCRRFVWRAWPWIAKSRKKGSAASSCWQREDAACWPQLKSAGWHFSSTQRMKG